MTARLTRRPGGPARLRAPLESGQTIVAPGAFDPLSARLVEGAGGKTPPVSLDRLKELGYRIVVFPISTLLAATGAMRGILQEIARAGTPAAAMHELPTFAEFADFIGLPQVHEAEQRYTARTGSP